MAVTPGARKRHGVGVERHRVMLRLLEGRGGSCPTSIRNCHAVSADDPRGHGLSVGGARTRGGQKVRLLAKDGPAAAGLEWHRGRNASLPP